MRATGGKMLAEQHSHARRLMRCYRKDQISQEQHFDSDDGLMGMGTELQCSPNFFTTLPRSHGSTVTITFDTPQTRASNKERPAKEITQTGCASAPLQPPMETLQCHKESLRRTMLEHERIFKEQVRELHRLYRTQKSLMSQLQSREPKLHPLAYAAPQRAAADPSPALRSSDSPSTSSRHRHSAQLSSGEQSSHLGRRAKAGLGSPALTTCSTADARGQGDGFEHQLPSGEPAPARAGDAAQTQEVKLSTDTPSSCSDEECDLELTLSIGCGGSKKSAGRRSHSDTPSGCYPASSPNSTGHRTSSSTPARSDPGGRADPSAGFDRESLQRPAWLFQGLSLNRT